MLIIPFFEGAAPFHHVLTRVGAPILLLNASTALCLNIAVVYLIGSSSGLVLTLSGIYFLLDSHAVALLIQYFSLLSGVIKDILLVSGSVLLLGSTVTFTQVCAAIPELLPFQF